VKVPLFLIVAVCFASIALADDFKTIDGREYKKVKVSRVEPDGIVLITKSGISKVYFTELPKEVQERYHYNPQEAAEFTAQSVERNRQFLQQRAADEQKRAEERARYFSANPTPQPVPAEQMHGGALDERPSGPSVVIYGHVNQVVNEGLLVSVRTRNDIIGGEHIPNGTIVLVVGQFPGVYDDDKVQVQGSLIGSHQYTTVMGGRKTVRAVGGASVTKLNSYPF